MNNLIAYVDLKDVVEEVIVDDFIIEAVVNVRVVHKGTYDLIVDKFEVEGGMIRASTLSKKGSVTIPFNDNNRGYAKVVVNKFKRVVEDLVLREVKSLDEKYWEYDYE